MKADSSVRLMLAYLCVLNQITASLQVQVEILDRFELTDEEIAKVLARPVEAIKKARTA